MSLRLFNTLTNRLDVFRPMADNTVRMYACGPTVYDFGHIGNFRTFVHVDTLRRFLGQSGYKLQHVMNITDVDDKIIANAAKRGMGVREYAEVYEKAFLEDMQLLNIEPPEHMVRATEHIEEMAEFIRRLEQRGIAYRSDDGSYYFRIAKFPEYGKLSKKDFAGIEVGARVDVDEYDKEEARDFALWKSPKPGEASWETLIGRGRPGWHIECSVMAMKYLGESFDLHAGGEDLIFPHHENEIAQSEALTGKTFARFWMHVRFLMVEGEKMSKSLGNFYNLRDLILKGHKPSSLRFLLASVPYRKQLNFTFDGLKQAANSVERLRNFKLRLETSSFEAGANARMAELARETEAEMAAGLEDDLNTAQALAAIFDMVREANAAADAGQVKRDDAAHLLRVMQRFDEVFPVLTDDDAPKMQKALEWAKSEGIEIPKELAHLSTANDGLPDAEVERLIAERNAAKKARDFKRSDELRQELAARGIVLEDTKDGVRWKRK